MYEDPGAEQEMREQRRAERADERQAHALGRKKVAEQKAAEAKTQHLAAVHRREAVTHEEAASLHGEARHLQLQHKDEEAAADQG